MTATNEEVPVLHLSLCARPKPAFCACCTHAHHPDELEFSRTSFSTAWAIQTNKKFEDKVARGYCGSRRSACGSFACSRKTNDEFFKPKKPWKDFYFVRSIFTALRFVFAFVFDHFNGHKSRLYFFFRTHGQRVGGRQAPRSAEHKSHHDRLGLDFLSRDFYVSDQFVEPEPVVCSACVLKTSFAGFFFREHYQLDTAAVVMQLNSREIMISRCWVGTLKDDPNWFCFPSSASKSTKARLYGDFFLTCDS